MKQLFNRLKAYVFPMTAILVSAPIYAVTIRFFVNNPNSQIITGGVSGLSLIISRLLFSNSIEMQLQTYSILYIILNIPIFLLGYTSIGKKFAIFSFANVFLVSTFNAFMPASVIDFIVPQLANVEPIALAIFAGALAGISTGIALLGNTSGGGTDIIAVYFGVKKGVQIGRYLLLLNAVILVSGALIFHQWVEMLYSIVYIYTSSTVVDMMHVRNKKELLHIVTTKGEELSKFLIANSLHGCTIVPAKGAFTNQDKQILLMTISVFEVKWFMDQIQKMDPESFTMITSVDTIYGKFYMPPIG